MVFGGLSVWCCCLLLSAAFVRAPRTRSANKSPPNDQHCAVAGLLLAGAAMLAVAGVGLTACRADCASVRVCLRTLAQSQRFLSARGFRRAVRLVLLLVIVRCFCARAPHTLGN